MGDCLDEFGDAIADAGQRNYAIGPSALERCLRHSENCRCLAILDERTAARLADSPRPLGTVTPHSCQDDRHRRRAEKIGRRSKEQIGGGSNTPERRRRIECDDRPLAFVTDSHVVSARSNVHPTVHNGFAMFRFVDANRAHRVETLRETLRETGWHVLHDEHRRLKSPGELRNNCRECARPAGR
jgi:hypothetical protein